MKGLSGHQKLPNQTGPKKKGVKAWKMDPNAFADGYECVLIDVLNREEFNHMERLS